MDSGVKSIVERIPLFKVNAGPRDEKWIERVKEEYLALIKYVEINKTQDNDWFKIESDKEGKKWKGKCWFIHNLVRYDFDLQFEFLKQMQILIFNNLIRYLLLILLLQLNQNYLNQMEKLTKCIVKHFQYILHNFCRGGKICLDIHFAPLWQKNSPKFGIAHALALGLGPWLAAEIPVLVEQGVIKKN